MVGALGGRSGQGTHRRAGLTVAMNGMVYKATDSTDILGKKLPFHWSTPAPFMSFGLAPRRRGFCKLLTRNNLHGIGKDSEGKSLATVVQFGHGIVAPL